MEANIISIAVGEGKEYKKGTETFKSAYKKDKFLSSVKVTKLGLDGDFQIDKRYHGGEDKAIHICSSKFFDLYKELYGKEIDKYSFGSNLFIDTYDEKDICVGDIYTIGEVEVEVTQPRQPCWKIGVIFDKEVSRFISKYSATGWYVRVLKEGTINIDDKMVLKKRVSELNIKELTHYLHNTLDDKEKTDYILELKPLAQAYKNDFKITQKIS